MVVEEGGDKDNSEDNVGPSEKTKEVQRYRINVRNDPDRLEKMKQKRGKKNTSYTGWTMGHSCCSEMFLKDRNAATKRGSYWGRLGLENESDIHL